MSTATTRPSGPGAAIDHGLVPSTFSRPPHGAMAGLALVVRTATQPSCGGAAGPVHRRPEVVGVADADRADAVRARALDGQHAGPLGEHLADAVAAVEQHQRAGVGEDGRIGDARSSRRCASRAAYQGRRSIPCDWCPQRSACTRLSATSAASPAGTPRRGEHPCAERRAGSPARPVLGHRISASRRRACCIQRCIQTATSERTADVQPGGADGGPARPARGVPRRHDGQRGGLGAGRAGLPAVRRLRGRRRREPLPPLRALRATPTRSRRTRPPRTSPQWRTVAEQVLVGQVNTPGGLLATHTAEESA